MMGVILFMFVVLVLGTLQKMGPESLTLEVIDGPVI